MTTKGGFTGKVLYVDLTTRKLESRPTGTEDELRMWIGCSGLGLHMLSKMMRKGMDPLAAESPIIIMTGPLTGTQVPQSSSWAVVNLRQQAGLHPGLSFGHGYFGARIKHAGWDGIVITGQSTTPVYLWIDDDHVELKDALPYWGMSTVSANFKIREDLRDMNGISVACIGPGGERMLAGGCLRSDLAYSAGTAAPGTLAGSKRLKAIAVRGTKQVPLADPVAFAKVAEDWRAMQWNHKVTPDQHNKTGMPDPQGRNRYQNPAGRSNPVKNMSEYTAGPEGRGENWPLKPVGSYNCEMACHYETTIPSGPFAGLHVFGYSGDIMGSMHGLQDKKIAMGLTAYLDDLGLHESEVPSSIAMIMEAYNTGRLTKEQCNGLDLTWGDDNYQNILTLLDMTLNRQGIGAVLAQGIRATAQVLGLNDMAVHIKGAGFHGQYQINHPAMLFASIMAGGGPRWEVSNRIFLSEGEPDLGIEAPLDPRDPSYSKIAPKAVYDGQKKKTWEDNLGVCYFAMQGYAGIFDMETRAVRTAIGWDDFTADEAMLAGERFVNLQRMVSLFLGYKPEDDYDVSDRLLAPIASGPGKGRALKPLFDAWRNEYYRMLGWSPETGQPSRDALRRVGLAQYTVGK